MWRIYGAVRAFGRSHCNPQCRVTPQLPQHGEDELGTSLGPARSSSQTWGSSEGSSRHQDAGRAEGRRTKQDRRSSRCEFMHSPPIIDAFFWGAFVTLGLQLVKRLHESLPRVCRDDRRNASGSRVSRCLFKLVGTTLQPSSLGLQLSILPKSSTTSAFESEGLAAQGPADQTPAATASHSPYQSESEVSASRSFGELSWSGDASEKDSIVETQECLTRAAEKLQSVSDNSVSVVLHIMGLERAKGGDVQGAARWFTMAAEKGYAKAQYNLGLCYNTGRGVPKDINKAAVYFAHAAAQGHAMAQYNLAMFLNKNSGENAGAVEQLLVQAAHGGLREAQSYLGVYYTKAPHKDYKKAVKFLKMAAEQEDVDSMHHLGICLQHGWGVEVDLVAARSWYERAAERGQPDAQHNLIVFQLLDIGGTNPALPDERGVDAHESLSAAARNPEELLGAGHTANHGTGRGALPVARGNEVAARLRSVASSPALFPPRHLGGGRGGFSALPVWVDGARLPVSLSSGRLDSLLLLDGEDPNVGAASHHLALGGLRQVPWAVGGGV